MIFFLFYSAERHLSGYDQEILLRIIWNITLYPLPLSELVDQSIYWEWPNRGKNLKGSAKKKINSRGPPRERIFIRLGFSGEKSFRKFNVCLLKMACYVLYHSYTRSSIIWRFPFSERYWSTLSVLTSIILLSLFTLRQQAPWSNLYKFWAYFTQILSIFHTKSEHISHKFWAYFTQILSIFTSTLQAPWNNLDKVDISRAAHLKLESHETM